MDSFGGGGAGGLGSASGEITLSADGALRALDAVGNGLNDLGNQSGKVGGRFDALKNGVLGLGTALLAPMTMGLKGAVDLEQGIANVNASLGGLDASTLDALSDMFIEVGSASRYSATEVAVVSDELAKAGFSADQMLGGMTASVVELAQATGDGLGPATDGIIQAFAMWAPEIVGTELAITDAARAADILTIAANQSAGGIGDVIGGLRNAGPALAAVGMGFDEAAAAIALFTNYGYSGDEIGTKLSRTLTFLSKPTDEAAAAMEQYGIKAFDAQGKFIGFPALFDQLQAGFAGVGDESRLAALKLIFGAEAFDLMNLAIETGGDPLREFTGEMEKTGVAAEQSALRMDTLGAQFEELMESVQGFLTSLVNGVIPALRFLVDGANAVVNVLMKIPQPIKTVIGAIAGLMAGIAAINIAMQSSAAISALLGISMSGVGASLVALLPIIAAIGAAIGALYLAWRTNFLGIRDAVDAFRQVWQNLSDTVVNNPVSRALSAASAALRSFDVGFLDSLADKLTGLSMAFHDFMDAFGAIGGTQKVDIEVGGDDKVLERVENLDAADGFDYFVRLKNPDGSLGEFGQIMESYTDEDDPNLAHIKVQTDDGEYWTTIDKTTGEIGTGTIEVEADTKDARRNIDRLNDGLDAMDRTLRKRGMDRLADGLESIREFAGEVGNRFRDLRYNFDQFRNAGVGPVTSALYSLGAVFPSLEGVIRPLVGIVASLSDAFDHVTDALGSFFQGEWEDGFESLGLAAEDAWDAITQAFDIGLDLIMAAFDAVDWAGLWDFLRDTGSIIVDRLGDVASALWDWFVGVVTGIDWGGILSSAWDVLSGAGSWITGKLGEAWTFIRDWFVEQVGRVSWGDAFQTGIDALSSAGQWIYQKLGDAYENIKTWFSLQLSNVDWGALFQAGIVVLASAGSWIVDTFTDFAVALGAWFYGQVSGVPWQELFDLAINALAQAGTWIITKLGEITESLGAWFSEQVSGVNWENVATTIGTNLRTAVTTGVQGMANIFAILLSWVNDQIRGVNWSDVGSTFADLLIGAIKGVALLVGFAGYLLGQILLALVDVNWAAVAKSIGQFIIGAIKALASFLTGFGDTLLTEIETQIGSVSWSSVGTAIKDALVGAVVDVGQAVWDAIWGGIVGAASNEDGADVAGMIEDLVTPGKQRDEPVPIGDPDEKLTWGNISGAGMFGASLGGGLAQLRKELRQTSSAITQFGADAGTGLTTAQGAFTSFVGATVGVMGGWTTGIQTQVNSAMDTLKSRASGGTAAGLSSFTSFVSQTIGVMGGWSTGVSNQVSRAMDTLQSRIRSGTDSGRSAFQSFTSSVQSMMSGWGSRVTSIVNSTMQTMASRAQAGGQQLASAMRSGANNAASAVQSALGRIPGIVASVGGAAASAAYSVGANIGNSMAAGMRSALGAISAAANQMVAEADRAVRARARIASPSKLFAQLGEYVGEGFEQGIRSMFGAIARASEQMVHIPDTGRMAPEYAYAGMQGGNTQVITNTYVYAVRSDEWAAMVRQVEDAPAVAIHALNQAEHLAGVN